MELGIVLRIEYFLYVINDFLMIVSICRLMIMSGWLFRSSRSWFWGDLIYVTFVIRAIFVCTTVRISWAFSTLQTIASWLFSIRLWKIMYLGTVLLIKIVFLTFSTCSVIVGNTFLCHTITIVSTGRRGAF